MNTHESKQAEGRTGKSGLTVLHLWSAAPSQRASGEFSRKSLMVWLERCLAKGTRRVFKWLFICLYSFFQNPDQWSVVSANC